MFDGVSSNPTSGTYEEPRYIMNCDILQNLNNHRSVINSVCYISACMALNNEKSTFSITLANDTNHITYITENH